ncbi:helix-turn-helix transcriptional regulator [Streptomyces sp. BE303]|uniref:helix-turn-helix transcriptional regulator n=1 Tax=Streptomyces sp. BE303 TaxID=3002528 RepID=UPI002E76F839|nr:LuxR C-terminal-related transcriptional regulator [Streptomyces sp. BE303]MED7952473.1 LuxR C-terminal-related transcriptional regulator [Streptomyces sp. BE303]
MVEQARATGRARTAAPVRTAETRSTNPARTVDRAPGGERAAWSWDRPEGALARVVEVLRTPRPAIMPRLSEVTADLVPHVALAQLSGVCTYSPASAFGPEELSTRITSPELARVAEAVPPGRPWQGEAVLAGRSRPAVAVASAPAGSNGALLVLVRATAGPLAPLPELPLALLQQLWELVTTHSHHRAIDAAPAHAAASRASAAARARAIAELSGAHASALSAILAPLRAAALDDATARRSATDLAVTALLDLRGAADLDRELSEEPAATAFARLADVLRPLLRHSPVRLDLLAPTAGDRSVPADTAHTARAAVRSTVLAMLEQDGLGRLHVSWQFVDGTLRAVVRDDGPGLLTPDALAVHRTADRIAALAGRLTVDAVPGWGTTVTVDLPLNVAAAPVTSVDPLEGLQPRELEVLDQLAQGRRNREIAQALHISESTVKFHVANILAKLDVSSRGEAAALAHRAGLSSTPPSLHAAS